MQDNPKLAVEITNSGQQDEDNPLLLRNDKQIDRKILRRKRPLALEMDAGCRSGAFHLLLHHRECQSRAFAYPPVHPG